MGKIKWVGDRVQGVFERTDRRIASLFGTRRRRHPPLLRQRVESLPRPSVNGIRQRMGFGAQPSQAPAPQSYSAQQYRPVARQSLPPSGGVQPFETFPETSIPPLRFKGQR